MIEWTQGYFDCFRTCVACILEVPRKEVPFTVPLIYDGPRHPPMGNRPAAMSWKKWNAATREMLASQKLEDELPQSLSVFEDYLKKQGYTLKFHQSFAFIPRDYYIGNFINDFERSGHSAVMKNGLVVHDPRAKQECPEVFDNRERLTPIDMPISAGFWTLNKIPERKWRRANV